MRYIEATIAAIFLFMMAGCSTVNCTVSGDNNKITIEQPKSVSTSGSLTTGDNTMPAALVP